MPQTIDFKIGSVNTRAFTAMPPGAGKVPGVVVTFHRGGLDDVTAWMVDNAAAAGFVVISPNHYHVLPSESEEDIERRTQFLSDEQMTADLQAALGWLRAHNRVDASRLALIGTCMGGRTTLVGCETLADVWRAACIWYGGNSYKQLTGKLAAPATPERIKLIRAPMLGFFGNDDQNPSREDVNKLDKLLTDAGKTHTFYRYDGAGHGFLNPYGGAEKYRPAAAKDSWGKAMAFLHDKLTARAAAQ
jgi:carboxymethylenebutenolidase